MTAVLTLGLVAVLTAADQLIKFFVVRDLAPVGVKMLLPGVLQLHYTENTGAMMGMLGGKTMFMTIASLVVLLVLLGILLSGKIKPGVLYACLTLILAGGVGNIIDRIARGFVVDYIEALFVDFYIFNFADCLITVGAFAAVIYEIIDLIRQQKKKQVHTDG